VAAVRQTATALATTAGTGAADARRLSTALTALANGSSAIRAKASAVLIDPLNFLLDQIRNLLLAEPVTLQSLPTDLTADWIAKTGQARVQVFPKGTANDNATLVKFSKAVRAVAPNASGGSISIQAAGATISWAFIEAGLLSVVVITLLLLIVLRNPSSSGCFACWVHGSGFASPRAGSRARFASRGGLSGITSAVNRTWRSWRRSRRRRLSARWRKSRTFVR
jgi:hypothetical protein